MTAAVNDSAYFDALVMTYAVAPDRRGEAHVPCPACQHRTVPGTTHFSFSERGGHCFACGFSCSLHGLAKRTGVDLGIVPGSPTFLPSSQAGRGVGPRVRPGWRTDGWRAERLIAGYLTHPSRSAWLTYKPVTVATMGRWELGAGRLPSLAGHPTAGNCQHDRLIYPVRVAGVVVAFRGRSIPGVCGEFCPKWKTAYGSATTCFNLDNVPHGAIVVIAENPVDAMLAMQIRPDIAAIASTAGAGTWREEWTAVLAKRRPARVVVWYDNDLIGCAMGAMRERLVAEWRERFRERHPDQAVPAEPRSAAFRITNQLIEAGIKAVRYEWPAGAPPKADLGWAIAEGMSCAS